jgi:hypothetical protein
LKHGPAGISVFSGSRSLVVGAEHGENEVRVTGQPLGVEAFDR